MKYHRPMFKRLDDFIVLKPIRLTSSKVLQVGDKIKSGEYPRYRLLNWYKTRSIAKFDCAYSKDYIESYKRRNGLIINDKQIIQSYYQPILTTNKKLKNKSKNKKQNK